MYYDLCACITLVTTTLKVRLSYLCRVNSLVLRLCKKGKTGDFKTFNLLLSAHDFLTFVIDCVVLVTILLVDQSFQQRLISFTCLRVITYNT